MTTAIKDIEAPAARRTLQPDDCTLIVVDIQEKLLPPIFNKEQLVRNSQLLIRLAGILQLPIIATTQYSKGLGQTVPEIASLLHGVPVYDKVEFSCFGSDAFCGEIKAVPGNRNTLLVCGMEAHICVMQTVLGALDRGYIVHVPADAIGSRAESNWNIGIRRMESAGAVISSTEMMMYELMRASGTPVFKEMLKHLK
ncbi:MAG TPA: hydrolase [Terriglobales bacterium]|nr:hydrolase [Terriglobales bacterium]